jgi:hypothetical protein
MKKILNLLLRKKLTYEERVRWFINHYYETGMEYETSLDDMKNENLDNFKYRDEIIKIPKYKYIKKIHFILEYNDHSTTII